MDETRDSLPVLRAYRHLPCATRGSSPRPPRSIRERVGLIFGAIRLLADRHKEEEA